MSLTDLSRIERETFVARVEYHATLSSTNDRAVQLCLRGLEVPVMLVLAERQTAGRGRGENTWWSTEGSLTFSLALKAEVLRLPMERRPLTALTAGMAVCEMLRALVPDAPVGLKWPNDVHLDGRKVCGVLVEVPSSSCGGIAVGIGLNVNNTFTGAPGELQQRAASLADWFGRTFELTDVLVRLLQQFERELKYVANGESLTARWRQFCVLQDRRVQLVNAGQTVTGVCRGIERSGALLLETGSGVDRYYGGTVRLMECI